MFHCAASEYESLEKSLNCSEKAVLSVLNPASLPSGGHHDSSGEAGEPRRLTVLYSQPPSSETTSQRLPARNTDDVWPLISR